MYVTKTALQTALDKLQGTANYMLRVWFVLKQMGMSPTTPVKVTTTGDTELEAFTRLFSFGHPEGKFFFPFAHSSRWFETESHAVRSILQTNLSKWIDAKVGDTDPRGYLDIERSSEGLVVKPGRRYPRGLGHGLNGFAMKEDARVQIPDVAFAVWYYRQLSVPEPYTADALIQNLRQDLKLDDAEFPLIFIPDRDWTPPLQDEPLRDEDVYDVVSSWLSGRSTKTQITVETQHQYSQRVKASMTTISGPPWLRAEPTEQLRKIVAAGNKAIILYGPPRTGKTRVIDSIVARDDPRRKTIQIHEGWGYDDMMTSFRPDTRGVWDWRSGELLCAIRDGKEFIVLEELNRTEASQALGEVFSLVEEAYRGEKYKITLRSGQDFFIPENVTVFATFNTLDKSTEQLDDALLGRFAGVEYPPRVEDLRIMLASQRIDGDTIERASILFGAIQPYYPLGHGYFAGLKPGQNFIEYYMSHIRHVLQSHLKGYRDQDLRAIDELVDQQFSAAP